MNSEELTDSILVFCFPRSSWHSKLSRACSPFPQPNCANPVSNTLQTIITTALPTISSYFNSSSGYTWIGSAYLATAASMPSWGKISDLFGRKLALLMSLAIFFVGSLICGVATTMSMLIAGRAVQGTGGGGILILVNVCTSDLFSMRWAYTRVLGDVRLTEKPERGE
jgi:MFS family permease